MVALISRLAPALVVTATLFAAACDGGEEGALAPNGPAEPPVNGSEPGSETGTGADAGVTPRPDAGTEDAGSDAGFTPPWRGLGLHPGETPISQQGGTYPRAAQLSTGEILFTWDSAAGADLALRTATSDANATAFTDRGIVAQHASGAGRTLGNAYPIALEDGSALVSFRHHSQEGSRYVYRLLASRTTTAGASFAFHSEIEVGANGIWEPLFFRPAPGILDVYYAREKVNGGDQDIVARRSTDAGKTWSARRVVATQTGSRDGMPSVVKLKDGSLVAVFESFRAPRTAKFVIRTVQSNDGGLTWSRRQDLYVPANATKNAGAPFLTTLSDGRLVASFMTDEDSASQNWPNHAAVKILGTRGVPTFASLSWDRATLETATPAPAYWPALFTTKADDVLVLYEKGGPKFRRAHWY